MSRRNLELTKEQAKQVIDMMFKDKAEIPKEDVLKVIDMIDDYVSLPTITCPTITCPQSSKIWYSTNTHTSDGSINLCKN